MESLCSGRHTPRGVSAPSELFSPRLAPPERAWRDDPEKSS
jgi:hypothetical protein